jgi:tRNA nucleotidyltransferase (CCA-adding enzyme)
VLSAASSVRAALRLENERVLSFEIHEGAAHGSFRVESARLHAEARPGPAGGAAASGPSFGGLTAEQIMTRTVMIAHADELVEDVAKRLAFHNISGMPVEDWDGKVIGVISEIDVIGKFHDTIREAMSADLLTVARDAPLEQVAALMTERRIKRVPVLEGDKLVGIVTRADIVRALADRPAAPSRG